jgi:hypothetical protein
MDVMLVRNWSGAARFGLPGLIMGIAVSWIGGARGPEAAAQTGPGADASVPAGLGQRPNEAARMPRLPGQSRPLASGEAGGTMAFVASPGGTAQWLYLIDTNTRAFAVYRVDPSNPGGKGVVKLEAARQYQFDLKLEHYNNQAPEPAAIEATVKATAQNGRPKGDR